MSHFSSAPLIKCKISRKRNMIFTSAERINVCQRRIISLCVCIIRRKLIVIGTETNEAMDPEGHQFTLHFRSHCTIFVAVEFLPCHRLEPVYFWRYWIIIKSLDPLRAKKTFIRKELDHTMVSAIKDWNVSVIYHSIILVPGWPRFKTIWF